MGGKLRQHTFRKQAHRHTYSRHACTLAHMHLCVLFEYVTYIEV